ncbi:hypothetical protein ERJ75_000644100 [Trypanosoma vivax]|nr:hypothetical protein ERJ75_000644100 [Trypanosoma vivax]
MEACDLALRESGGGGISLWNCAQRRCWLDCLGAPFSPAHSNRQRAGFSMSSLHWTAQCRDPPPVRKARTNMRTQRRREETNIAVADVGSKDREERIRQLKDKTPQEPARAASLQDTVGPRRAENGLLKAGTVRPCAKRKRGPEHTKVRAQRPVAAKVSHRSFSRTQSQRTAAAAPRAGNGCRWFSRNPGVAGCARRGAFHAGGQHSHARGRARVYDADLARTLFESVSRPVSNAAERRLSGV